jgi:autotransporter-associated beta strand protein
MKTISSFSITKLTALVMSLLLTGAAGLQAANGTWTSTAATGNWSDIANWNSGSGPVADGTDFMADFSTLNLANAVVVTQDTPTGKTIGGMKFGSTGGVFNWTLTALGGTNLNMATTTGYPTITIPTNTVTISLPLAGTNGLMIVGPGTLAFGAAATYTNDTIITNGATVQEANNYFGNTIINFYGGNLVAGNSSSFGFPTFNIPAGQTGSLTGFSGTSRYTIGVITGAGTMNLGITCTAAARTDLGGNCSGFTGIANITGAGSGRMMANGGTFGGFPNATMTMNTAANLQVNLNTGGNTFQFGALSGTSPGAIIGPSSAGSGNGTLLCGSNNASTTFAGLLSGNVAITKWGTGTMTFTNNSTMTGPTLVATGAVFGVTGGSFSNSIVTVATNLAYGGSTFGVRVASTGGQWAVSNLVLRSGSQLTFNYGAVAPSTSVAPLKLLGGITATNTVTLNVLGGAGWVVNGAYPLAKYASNYVGNGFSAFALGTQPLRVTGVLSNDTVNSQIFYVVSAVSQPLHWSAGNGSWDIATTANWQDAANVSTTYQEQIGLGDQVLFNDTASGASPITVTLGTNVTPAGVTFSNVAKNYVLAGISNILGATGLTKTGNATLTIQNTNFFTGAVSLNGGVVNFKGLVNLGTGTAVNFGGGTLQYAAGNTDDISTRTVTINAGGATIDTAANSVVFNGRIGNNGAGGLVKTGSGALTLNTNSTYNGNTVISNGVVVLGASASLSNSPAIIVNAGAALDAFAPGLNLNSALSQILAGSGVVTGNVTVGTSTVVTPATNGVAGILSFTNDFNLNGGVLNLDVSRVVASTDRIRVGGSLLLNSGTININVLGAALTNGTYKLIEYPAFYYNYGLSGITLSGFSQSGQIAFLDDSTPGEISLVVGTASANKLTWIGDVNTGNYWDPYSLNWLTNTANFNTLTNFNNGDTVRFDDTTNNFTVNLGQTLFPAAVVVDSTNDYVFANAGGKLAGSASLTKSNSGSLLVLTANNQTGPILIAGGRLQVGDGGAGGTALGSGNVTNNGALIFNQPDDYVLNGSISGTGSLTKQGGGRLTLRSASTYAGLTLIDTGILQIGEGGVSGALAPSAVILTNGGTLSLNHLGTYSLANGISGDGTLRFDGGATVTFGGVNSYLYNTYISGGLVKLAAANVIPSGGLTSGWLILDGGASSAGALDLNGFNQSVNALSGLGGTVQGRIYNNGSSVNTLTVGTLATTTYAGLILDNINAGSGKVGLTVTGNGSLGTALTLSGANSYSGPVLIDGASVIMGGAIGTVGQLSIGTGPITLTNGGSLQMNGYGSATQSGNFVNNILVPAGVTAYLKTVGRGTYTGSLTVHGTLNLTTSYVRSNPTGDWSASDGQINIIAGTLGGDVWLNNAGNINWGTAAVDLGAGVAVYNSANTGAGGNTFTIGELTGSGSISDTSGGSAPRVTTYVVGGRNTSATFSGTIFNRTRITAIEKVGTGAWTLNGTDTYTGATTVTGGSLIVGPSSFMAASTLITVNNGSVFDISSYGGLILSAGQTLAGNGVITGAVTLVASDLLSPGVGTLPGTLSFSNNVTLTGDFVTNNFNLSSDPTGLIRTNSRVIVAGDLTLTGSNVVTINPLNSLLGAGTYTLFKYSGSLITNGVVAGAGARLNDTLVPGGAFAANSAVTLIFSNAPGAVVMIVTTHGQNLVWSGGVTGTATNNWDVNVSSNWLNGVVVTNFLTYDNAAFDDSSTNLNVVLVGALAPGVITVNSTNSYTFSGAGRITGATGLTKSGTNQLTLGNTGGNDYTGAVIIRDGILKAGVATALGATNGSTIVTNTGALDVGGFNLGAEPVVVSGNGSGGGAILNTGAAALNALQYVTLAGNTTFGGNNRWDVRANTNGALAGNGFTLTKISTNDIYLVGLSNTALGGIQVQQGRLGLQDNTLLGAGSAVALFPGAGLDLWNNSVTNTKALTLTNATLSSSSGTNVYGGTINLNGLGTLTATTPLQVDGAVSGTGGLLKIGVSTLNLTGGATYTGNTTISNGVLVLSGATTLATSPNVDLAVAGAALDVSASGLLTLAPSQTLKGIGSVRGSVTVGANATVAPGESGVGTLTVTNVLTLAGTTLLDLNTNLVPNSDRLVATNINYGGALVLNLASGVAAGNSFQLFSAAAYGGSFSSITPATPGAGLAWNTSLLASSGVLSIVATGPSGPARLTNSVSGNTLSLSWPAGEGWTLQWQTNSLTTGLGTNWVDVPGSTSISSTNITINPVQPTAFYRLKY